MRFIVYMFAGLAGGILGGMGMGGGTVLIPILTIFCGVEQHLAQSANLITFLPMAIFSLQVARQARAFGYARHRLYHIARARSVRRGRSVGQPYRRRGAAKGIRHLFMPVVGMAVHLRVKEHCRQEAGRRRAILSGNSLQAWGKVVKYQATSYQKTEQRIGG